MGKDSNYWTDVFARRLSRRRALHGAAAGGLGAAAIGVVGCGDDDDDDDGGSTATAVATQAAEPKRGGTLRGTIPNDPPVLDPYKSISFLTLIPASFVYSRLLRYKPQADPAKWGDREAEGDLAESWEASPDALTWTFHLREGVTFHDVAPVNGRPVDSEDVVLSWERWLALPAANAKQLNMIERVEAPDPRTVVITLNLPYAPFETIIASPNYFWIMPKEVANDGIDLTQTMLGSGPFLFDSYEPGVAMRFRSNPNYWEQGLPYVDGVDLHIIKDPATTLSNFMTGGLDVHAFTNPRDVAEIRRQKPEVKLDEFLQTLLLFSYVQPISEGHEHYSADSPFNDERVRRALSMALDRDALLQVLYQGEGKWNTLVPAGFTKFHLNPKDDAAAYGEAANYFKFDIEGARKLLADAGYPDGISAQMHYTNNAYGDLFNQSAEVINRMWNDAGIKTTLAPEDYRSQYISSTFLGNFDGVAYGPQSGFDEADQYLFSMLHSSSERNHSKINDPELDKLIEAQRVELDSEARVELMHDIQKLIADKMYYIPTVVGKSYYAQHPNVKGFTFGAFYSLGTESYARVWLEP